MKIENLIKLIPIGAIILTLISGIKLAIYYSQFGISIFDFTELNEIIILFFDDILYYLSVFTFLLVIYLLLRGFSNFELSFSNENINTNEDKDALRKFNHLNKTFLLIVLISLIPLSVLVYFSDYSTYLTISTLKYNAFVFLTILLIYAASKGWIINLKPLIILYFGIITLGFLSVQGVLEAELVKSNENSSKYAIEIKTIEENSNDLRYIGKTNNYLFLYNSKNMKSLIFPIDQLDLIIIER